MTTRRRGAFTLLEILVVVAIIVVLASLSWPALLRYVGDRSIREQAHEVRMELARTRTKAIDTGLTYQFRFEPGGRRYVVLPNDRPEAQGSGSASGSSAGGSSKGAGTAIGLTPVTPSVPVVSGKLPERVTFDFQKVENAANGALQTQASQRLPDEWLALLPENTLLREVGWSPPILFFPDGTADDAYVMLLDAENRQVELCVRGLTGTIDSEEPRETAP